MFQVCFFRRRTTEQLGMEGAGQELEVLEERMRAQGMGYEAISQMQELILKLRGTVRRTVRNFTERELQQQNHNYMEKFRREMLTEKSFYHLTEDEILRMREVVTRLAQRIKNILSIRKKRLKKGKLEYKLFGVPALTERQVQLQEPVAEEQQAQSQSPQFPFQEWIMQDYSVRRSVLTMDKSTRSKMLCRAAKKAIEDNSGEAVVL